MGKKKGKGKSKRKPKEEEKPFTFDINNFKVERTAPGLMKLFPVIPDGFHQVAFKLKITKNLLTGKPKYDIVYYECSLLDTQPEDEKDMKVFSIVNVDTGRTLIVDPKKTQGRQPFLALDPVTNKEEPISPPLMIHYDAETGKRYLLDVNKFEEGKLEFKDPQTQEKLIADLTKRVDPLTGKPLHGGEDGVTFVGQIKNGEMYIVKSNETGQLQILDHNGNPVDVTSQGYHTLYDAEANTTTLLDEKDEALITLPGNVQVEQLDDGEENETEDMEETNKKFKVVQDPDTGKIKIVNEKGEVVEASPNQYFVFQDPITGKPVLLDSSGQPVPNMPKFKLAKDPVTGKTILVSMGGQPLAGTAGLPADMILEDATPSDEVHIAGIGRYRMENPMTGDLEVVPRIHLIRDPVTGQPLFLDSKDQMVPAKKLYEVVDPVSGNTLYFDRNGRQVLLDAPCTPQSPMTENKEGDGLEALLTRSTRPLARPSLPLLPLSAPHSVEEGTTKEEKTEQEKYFDDLEYEEARNIVLMDVIELNRDLIKCTLKKKMDAEKTYMFGLIEEKEQRQAQFVRDQMRSHAGDYGKTQVQAIVLRKLDRENELLLYKLDARITAENKVIMDVVKENVIKDSRKIIKYTNIPCYRNFKRIVYKELMKNLEKEIEDVKTEACRLISNEKDTILDEINNFV
ncbi:hypothetical protein M8J75_005476 [Diaphorina citri]|nr:hypothetical protein M8J75_005476 [Diaphorina citri]